MSKNMDMKFGLKVNVDNGNLKTLEDSLKTISRMTASDMMNINKGMKIQDAVGELKTLQKTASQLEVALKNAYSSKLNTTDVTKLKSELSKVGLSVGQIKQDFMACGNVGKAAFKSFATDIMSANLQLKQTNSWLDKMATTMGNTAKWGISSSIFNSLTGSIQKAYSYVKQLDTSLNNIQIVTGKSADEMAVFAKQANNAAKALGSTTNEYAKASLIFYQQGIESDEEIQKRTDITIKMANVTGEAAKDVSSYMTAIWNNFSDGSETLEHYADVITALGASTASSSSEIAEGLEKFASIGKTVGLTYEYATSALATVVAATRQSADTVGTAFKTLFARIQGLSLGETLDDGTTLTKYSKALNSVGISIKDQSGELKDMNTILDEMGAKWGTLSKDQQVALAQTVAGTRQYTQLVALMDNWDNFGKNLKVASDATGTLQEQQDIYLESAEAHLSKMQASFEDLYDSIFDADAIKVFADLFGGLADGMAKFSDAIGGGSSMLLTLGGVGLQVFDDQIGRGLATTVSNIKAGTIASDQLAQKWQFLHELKDSIGVDADELGLQETLDMMTSIENFGSIVSAEQQNMAASLLRGVAEIENQQQAWDRNLEAASEYYENITGQSITPADMKEDLEPGVDSTMYQDFQTVLNEVQKDIDDTGAKLEVTKDKFIALGKVQVDTNSSLKDVKKAFGDMDYAMEDCIDDMTDFIETGKLDSQQVIKLTGAITKYREAVAESSDADVFSEKSRQATEELMKTYSDMVNDVQQKTNQVRNIVEKEAAGMSRTFTEEIDKAKKEWNSFIDNLKVAQGVKAITNITGGVMQLAGALKSLIHISDIWNDDDLSSGEKALEIFMAVGTAIGTGITAVLSMVKTLGALKISLGGAAAAEGVAGAAGATMWTAILGPIALVIAGVAAVGLAIYGLVKWFNADADAAKSAKEQVQELSNAYDECKQRADEFREANEKYEKAKQAVEDMKSSMEGYKEAVDEANKAAEELIEKYKLYGQFSYDENGVIQIDQDALDKIDQQKQQAVQDSQEQLYGAKINANNKQLKSDTTDLRRDINNHVYSYDQQTGYNRQVSNDDVSSIVAAMNSIENIGTLSNEELANKVSEITGLSDEYMNELFTSSDGFREKLEELANSTEDAQKANEYYAEEILKMTISDKYSDRFKKDNTDENGEVNEKTANNMLNAQEALMLKDKSAEKAKEEIANIDVSDAKTNNSLSKYGYKIDNDEDLARTYAKEVLGYSDEEANDLTYKGGWDKGTLKTADGTKVLDGYSDKKMREQLARKAKTDEIQAKYDSESDANGENIANALEKLKEGADEAGAQYGTDFTDAILASVANGSKDLDLSSSFEGLSQSEVDALSQMDDEELLKALHLDEETLKTLGYGSAENFAKEFKAGLEDYDVSVFNDAADKKGDEEAEKWGIDKDELNEYRKLLADTYDELADNREALNEVAVANKRMEQGVKSLCKDWKTYDDIMSDSSSSMEDISSILPDVNSAVQDILNLDNDEFSLLPADFAQKNWDLINDVTNGVEGSVDKLRDAAGKEIIMNIAGDDTELQNSLMDIQNTIAAYDSSEFKIGVAIDDEKFKAACTSMIQQAGMTAEQANAYFKSMGYDVELEEVKKEDADTTDYSYYKLDQKATDAAGGVPQFESSPTKISVQKENSGTAYAVKTITPNGSYGGGTGVKTTASKGSTSGKKSSGGGSSSKKSTTKHQDSEKDRYQKVNSELGKISDTLTKLQKQAERLTGKALIDNLVKQIKTINSQLETTDRKLAIAKDEASEYAQKLASAYGISFDGDGVISNYSSAYDAELARYNAAIDAYNASSQSDGDKDALDAAKERYDKFKKLVSDYDTLIGSTIPGLEDNIDSQISAVISAKMEIFNTEVTVKLDLDEASKKWAEFKKNVLENVSDDDFSKQAKYTVERYTEVMNDGVLKAATNNAKRTLEELNKMRNQKGYISTWFGANGVNDESAALKNLNEQKETIMEYMTEANEKVKELQEILLSSYDKTKEYFDERKALYEDAIKTYEHDMKLIQSIYGEEAYSQMTTYYDKIGETYKLQLDSQKANTQYWLKQMEAQEEGTKAWEKARDNWLSSLSEEQAALESYIDSMVNKYTNAIQAIFEKLNTSITGGKGLAYVSEEWGQISTNAENYLDSINSAYKIQELQNKYLDSIEKSTNVEVQQKLNKLMNEQVTMLKEKDKLSQYDLDRANLQYEIALKQIALEEAQQNKSTMRLKRDSQGNYSYQYAADEDKISSLREELSDLYNQLYNLDANQYKQNLNDIYSVWEEYQQKMAEAAQINDPEQRKEREELLEQYYGERINNLVGENEDIKKALYESTFLELEDLYGANSEAFKNAMLDQEGTMATIVAGWTSSIQIMADAIRSEGGFEEVYKQSLKEIQEATKEYQQVLDGLQDELDTTSEKDGIIQKEIEELLTSTNKFINASIEGTKEVSSYLTELNKLVEKYKEISTEAEKAATAANKVNTEIKTEQINAAGQVKEQEVKQEAPKEEPKVTTPSTPAVTQPAAPSLSVGSYVNVKSGVRWYTTAYGEGPSGKARSGSIRYTHLKGTHPYNIEGLGWIKKTDIVGYKTGGYTGNWSGQDGKLAVLHQKELILNAADTENVLKAIGILRNITTSISGLSSVPGVGNSGTLAQDVHIEATFPNVVSSNEIENALNNLVNVASQRIQER